jgi:hypothetical protein
LGAIPTASIGIWFYSSTSALLEKAITAQGTVIELRESRRGSSNRRTYKSIFEFTDNNGKLHTIVPSVAANPPSHEIGEKVEVLYDPNEPQNARINSFLSLWFVPLCCAVLSLVPFVLGLVFWIGGPSVTRYLESKNKLQNQ